MQDIFCVCGSGSPPSPGSQKHHSDHPPLVHAATLPCAPHEACGTRWKTVLRPQASTPPRTWAPWVFPPAHPPGPVPVPMPPAGVTISSFHSHPSRSANAAFLVAPEAPEWDVSPLLPRVEQTPHPCGSLNLSLTLCASMTASLTCVQSDSSPLSTADEFSAHLCPVRS